MLDVLTIGDLMIDFTSLGTNEAGKLVFERNPGGAPANVASQVARLGGSSGFIGSVGQDEHGLYLIETMKKLGIDVSCLRISDKEATRITFVYLNQGNDRYFSNYQSPRADHDLPEDERYYRQVDNCRILHFASTSQFGEPIAATSSKLMAYARKQNKLISYDPNWNEVCGYDEGQKKIMTDTFKKVDILKISREEYSYFIGDMDIREGAAQIISQGVRLLAITMGAGGCYYRTRGLEGYQPSYQVAVRDTTGSGDSFMGALLYQIAGKEKAIEDLKQQELDDIIRFSNACGSTCATKTGSLTVMPGLPEVTRTMGHTELYQMDIQCI